MELASEAIIENLWVCWLAYCLNGLDISSRTYWMITIPTIILVALPKLIGVKNGKNEHLGK